MSTELRVEGTSARTTLSAGVAARLFGVPFLLIGAYLAYQLAGGVADLIAGRAAVTEMLAGTLVLVIMTAAFLIPGWLLLYSRGMIASRAELVIETHRHILCRCYGKGKAVNMASERSLPRASWSGFFDLMSKSLIGQSAEIEVSSLDLGDQIVAEWVPMLGITYEPHADALNVALDRLDHQILHPREIVVRQGPDGLASIAVVDGEGTKQVVRLKSPMMLPAAAS